MTPPPEYNDIASPSSGLADYFSRLADTYDDEDSDDDRANTRGRVNIPLTPGSRINRSMELARRDWGGLTNVRSGNEGPFATAAVNPVNGT